MDRARAMLERRALLQQRVATNEASAAFAAKRPRTIVQGFTENCLCVRGVPLPWDFGHSRPRGLRPQGRTYVRTYVRTFQAPGNTKRTRGGFRRKPRKQDIGCSSHAEDRAQGASLAPSEHRVAGPAAVQQRRGARGARGVRLGPEAVRRPAPPAVPGGHVPAVRLCALHLRCRAAGLPQKSVRTHVRIPSVFGRMRKCRVVRCRGPRQMPGPGPGVNVNFGGCFVRFPSAFCGGRLGQDGPRQPRRAGMGADKRYGTSFRPALPDLARRPRVLPRPEGAWRNAYVLVRAKARLAPGKPSLLL